MIKVKELIEFLKSYNPESYVIWNTGQEIKHISSLNNSKRIVLSDHKYIGKCNRCNENVFKSIVLGYSAYCPHCDEDLYKIEFTVDNTYDTSTEI